MSIEDRADTTNDDLWERAEQFLESDNLKARIDGRNWSSVGCMADFARMIEQEAMEKVADELVLLFEKNSHNPDYRGAMWDYIEELLRTK